MCVSQSVVFNSLWSQGLQPTRLLCPWNSPSKNTGVDSHSLLQRIFLIQASNLSLPYYWQILYHLSHQGSPFPLKQEEGQTHQERMQNPKWFSPSLPIWASPKEASTPVPSKTGHGRLCGRKPGDSQGNSASLGLEADGLFPPPRSLFQHSSAFEELGIPWHWLLRKNQVGLFREAKAAWGLSS